MMFLRRHRVREVVSGLVDRLPIVRFENSSGHRRPCADHEPLAARHEIVDLWERTVQ